MKTLELMKDLYWCGIQDPELRTFDIIMTTEFGTTYNSYLLRGSEKCALVETAKCPFAQEYLDTLAQLIDLDKLDYLIVNHTEPDHTGSIAPLLERRPNLKIVGSVSALTFLKHIVGREFNAMPVKEGDTLSLGDKTLKFISAPNLHWPDTMYTYWQEGGVLFTCDSFGAHYTHEGMLRSNVPSEEDYHKALRYYYDMILGPFKRPFMVNAMKKIAPLTINMICTGHGPVLDTKIDEIMALYTKWNQEGGPYEKKTAVIPYVTSYGYTEKLAHEIARGIRESGDVVVHVCEVTRTDHAKLAELLARADALLFGTPTILGEALEPIWDLVSRMFPVVHGGKLATAFGSYGWSGEGVPHIIERLKQLKMNVPDDGFRVRFRPHEEQLKAAHEYGYNIGCLMQGIQNPRA